MSAASTASTVGTSAVFLTFFLPVLLWWILRRYWKPKTRRSYALKFALWPAIIFSSQLAGPLAGVIFYGFYGRYEDRLISALQGVTGLIVLLAPIFFVIGYYIGRKKFQQSSETHES